MKKLTTVNFEILGSLNLLPIDPFWYTH